MATGEYVSVFTGEEIDARLAQVPTIAATLLTKQDVINDIETIRSGAAAGVTAYQKPNAGIPKTDMTEGVQTSLGKADSAYQKPGSGIPKSDLSSDVQASLDKADSAVQDVSGKADKDTDAVDGNLAEFDEGGNPVDSGIPSTKIGEIEDKVTALGNSAGIAEGIADSVSAGTPQEIVFRRSGGDGVNYMKAIKGRTLAWNQLVKNGNFAGGTTGWSPAQGSIAASGGVLTYTVASPFEGNTLTQSQFPDIANHMYLFRGELNYSAKPTSTQTGFLGIGGYYGASWRIQDIVPKSWFKVSGIITSTGQAATKDLRIYLRTTGMAVGDTVQLKNIVAYDLTLMFGKGNEPSTVEEFESLFPLPYYEYNAGTPISNDATALETVGFNQIDLSGSEFGTYNQTTGALVDNTSVVRCWLPVVGGLSYYIKNGTNLRQDSNGIGWYDAEHNYLGNANYNFNPVVAPSSAAFGLVVLRAVSGTITLEMVRASGLCINLSDASKNGTYEPYWKRNILLNLSTLKDKGGNLVFPYAMNGRGDDFDKILPDANGQMTIAERLWDRRAYQSGDEDDASVITDGRQYTFVKLATPVVSELAEPIPNAILVDELGTERAIFPEHEDGTPSAPLCTNSNYSISVQNLVAKLNALNG